MEPTEARTARRTPTLRNYIGGEWVESAAEETLEDRNPATGELAALVPLSSSADVDAAVQAAGTAQPAWRAVAPQNRARGVNALRAALWEHRERIAQLVTEDMGKTLDDARGEVVRGIESAEAAIGIPTPSQRGEPGRSCQRSRRRTRSPARWRRRGDHPVQLPRHDPTLVLALRDRLRQQLHPQNPPSAIRDRLN